MYYHVLEARYVGGYVVWLRFQDGTSGEVDLATELRGPVFEPLRDPSYFKASWFIRNFTRSSGRMVRTLRRNSCTAMCGSRLNLLSNSSLPLLCRRQPILLKTRQAMGSPETLFTSGTSTRTGQYFKQPTGYRAFIPKTAATRSAY